MRTLAPAPRHPGFLADPVPLSVRTRPAHMRLCGPVLRAFANERIAAMTGAVAAGRWQSWRRAGLAVRGAA